jgi:signal transduction histidine kinase
MPEQPQILIVDDEPANVELLEAILRMAGFAQTRSTTDPRLALAMAAEMNPDLVLLDLSMPGVSGYEVLGQLRATRDPGDFLPIIVLTADVNPKTRRRALQDGANDFVTKPFSNDEVILRCKSLLEVRSLHLALQSQNARLEERVLQRTQELERALTELKTAQERQVQVERLRALGEMSNGVALDFNNQLTVLIGYTDLLLLNNAQMLSNRPMAIHYLKTINTAARDSAGIVARLRDFHRSRTAEEIFLPVNLPKLVQETAALTQPKWKNQARADGRQIAISLDLEPVSGVSGNAAELREVVTALIFNAVDAMPQGGTVQLRTRREQDRVLLEVIDTGIGMTEEVRRRCLEPFFTTKDSPGAGLGLSVVYGIVKRHEGVLDISTEIGGGTTVTVRLPAALAGVDGETHESARLGRPLRVLLVEDDPLVREVVGEYLRRDDHEVSTAVTAQDGLAQFVGSRFDLVVTDLALEGMNGERLAMEIKERAADMPIILLSGFGNAGANGDQPPAGIDAVLRKPLAPGDLWRAVAQVMSRREPAQPAELVAANP